MRTAARPKAARPPDAHPAGGPATRRLRVAIIRQALRSPLTPTPLRGRDGEIAVIGDTLASARRGQEAILFVAGRPGFGKTRLLAEAAALAKRRGFRVGAGAVAPSD